MDDGQRNETMSNWRAVSATSGGLKNQIAKFNDTAETTQKSLDRNPYSDTYQRPVHKTTDQRYGRPEQGSKTERRGIAAGNYVCREIVFLCEIINKFGTLQPDGTVIINFGTLFEIYAYYSDKVVGMLLRARKYGLVAFEGEMLYQRQDDNKIITMLKPLAEIQQTITESGDPVNCMAAKR